MVNPVHSTSAIAGVEIPPLTKPPSIMTPDISIVSQR
jgi:hypothetical protein